jgi:hypothetical protein
MVPEGRLHRRGDLHLLREYVMQRIAGIALLAVGILLALWGVNASNSVGSSFSKLFTGAPTDKSILLLVGGIVVAIAGAGMAWFPRGDRP